MTVVTLYGKPGCHLCHEARAEIERVRAERPFDLEEIDVSLDPGLQREYGERIPVVAIGGGDGLQAPGGGGGAPRVVRTMATGGAAGPRRGGGGPPRRPPPARRLGVAPRG